FEHCGAKDLAQAAESAEPSFRDWSANHPYFNGHVGGRRGGGGNIGGGGDAESTLIIISALVAGSAAYVATDSLLTNIYSTLDPTPSLEDVLEAYNQRLAAALGMDPSDSALVTSMPHALGLSGRDRARSLRLVRAGIACGLIAMIVGSVDLFTTANNGQGTDAWAKPVFFGGAGLLGASLIFGYTEAW
ncbi:MAG TPA: hypothetical protein VK842_07035, partial [bacterium]|nr:hypothetical protein [bacterium]